MVEGLLVVRKQERKKETPYNKFSFLCLVCKMWTDLSLLKCLYKTHVTLILPVGFLNGRRMSVM